MWVTVRVTVPVFPIPRSGTNMKLREPTCNVAGVAAPSDMSMERGNATTVLITAAAFVVIVAGMRAASTLLVPFLVSALLAVLCATPMTWLVRKGMPRALAVVAVLALILGVGTLIGGLVGQSIVEFTRSMPRYQERLVALQGQTILWLESLVWLQAFDVDISEVTVFQYFNASRLFALLQTLVASLGQVLTNGVVILVTTVFMLLEMSGFPAKIRAAFGESEASLASSNFTKVALNVRKYLALKTVISLGTGIGIAIWLTVIDVDFPVLWGLLAFLLNYIPNIGSFLAAIPAVLFAIVQAGPGTALAAAIGFLVVNTVMANFLEPRVMGYGVGLSTLVVFVSLVFWGWVLGPVGMILSVPLTVIFRIVLEANDSTRWLAILLGSERMAAEMAQQASAGEAGPQAEAEAPA